MTAYRLLKFCSLILLSLGASCKDKDMVPGTHNPPMESGLYVTDFSEYATGAAPSDWSTPWATSGFTALVQNVAGSLSGKALRWSKTGATRQALVWDKIPLAATVEVLMRVRAIEAEAGTRLILGALARAGGAATTTTVGYMGKVGTSSTSTRWLSEFSSYVSGSNAAVGSATAGPSPNYTTNTWVWLRFRVEGNLLSRRIWYYGTAEPGTWAAQTTDTAISAAGATGLVANDATPNPDAEVDYFAVGIGGISPQVPN